MADGGPVIQGSPGWGTNVTQTPSQLVNGAAAGDGTGLYLFSGGNGRGLYVVGRGFNRAGVQSYSYAGDGVSGVALPYGSSSSAGVRGQSLAPNGAGVHGSHQRFVGVWGDGTIGTVGQSTSDFGIGVEGDASGQGAIGVFGAASGSRGVGVYATAPSPDSAALQVNGRAVFSSAGRITVAAGATSGSQSGLSLSGAAFVLATLQQDLPGVLVRAAVADAAAGTVTVYLNQAPAVDATVGWMAVN
jgi:hypothetical protein